MFSKLLLYLIIIYVVYTIYTKKFFLNSNFQKILMLLLLSLSILIISNHTCLKLYRQVSDFFTDVTFNVPLKERIFYKILDDIQPEKLIFPYSNSDYVRTPIPKKIFRNWCTNKPVKECSGRIASLEPIEITRKTMPDWEQIIYGDEESEIFLDEYFGKEHRITKAYRLINHKYGAARSDLIRLLLIYIFGGFYIDMKSCVHRPLPEMPDDKDMIISNWAYPILYKPQNHLFKNGEFQNWYIYARKGAPILCDIIERVVSNIYTLYEKPYNYNTISLTLPILETQSQGTVLAVTGPIALTMAILNSAHKDTVLILPTINNSITYMCQKEKTRGGSHYSKQTESLILVKENALYTPKNVFLTYHDIKSVPQYVFDNINKYCSGFNIQIFDDNKCEEFLFKFFGEDAVNIFKNMKLGAHKADFWRYCILFVYGGCYFDIKTDFKTPIEQMYDFTAKNTWYTVIGKNKKSIYNGIIVTPPGNPVIWKAIRYIYVYPNPYYYLQYVSNLFDNIQEECTSPLSVGENIQQNGWSCYLQQEECVSCDETNKEINCDRYNLNCVIKDENGKINFNTRYLDFPWTTKKED